jgi:hypothetical protein
LSGIVVGEALSAYVSEVDARSVSLDVGDPMKDRAIKYSVQRTVSDEVKKSKSSPTLGVGLAHGCRAEVQELDAWKARR